MAKRARMLMSVLAVTAGNLLLALTIKLFLLPVNLAVGGTTGLALIAQRFLHVPISGFVLAFNLVMLAAGWLLLGRAFVMTTILSSVLYPLFLELCNRLLGDLVLTQDILLCAMFSGLGCGVALGLVIRAGASTGGMDIPPLALKRLLNIPVSVSMYAFDFCLLLIQLSFQPVEGVLYGILMTLVITIVLDRMQLIGTTHTEVKIISPKSEEICHAILHQVDRGATLLHAEGGYLHGELKLVLSIISNRELIAMEKLVHGIDPECFMVVSRVSKVNGRGFTIKKRA